MSHRRFSLTLLFPVLVFTAITFQPAQSIVAQTINTERTNLHTDHLGTTNDPYRSQTALLGLDPIEEPDDPDAEFLALEISGKLLPPRTTYNRIQNDLKTIRQAYPEMRAVTHYPRWELGHLVIGLTEEAVAQFEEGTHRELNRLNTLYEISSFSCGVSLHYCQFAFARRYNPHALEYVYMDLEDVRYAEPKYMIGDGSEIRIDPANSSKYHFIYRWTDCLSGCIHQHMWVFDVSGREVVLVEEYGDPLVDTQGTPIAPFAPTPSTPHFFYFPMMLKPSVETEF